MSQSVNSRLSSFRLGLLALLCAIPFLAAAAFLKVRADRIDTLPLDEYKDLFWDRSGRDLFLTHRPLLEDAATELWLVKDGMSFQKLLELPLDRSWRLTGQFLGGLPVLAGINEGGEELSLVEGSELKPVAITAPWTLLHSIGQGIFCMKEAENVPYDGAASIEDAPEVSYQPGSEDKTRASRRGLVIGRYDLSQKQLVEILTIPYVDASDKPSIQLVEPSPDERFLAIAASFGRSKEVGVWVFDRETNRLLWTRIVIEGKIYGLGWSESSVSLAACDERGVVLLGNVLGVESTRYEAQGLGVTKPLFGADDKLYLVASSSLYRVKRQDSKAQIVFDSHSKGMDALNFTANPSATEVAFLSTVSTHFKLFVCDLNGENMPIRELDLPGSLRSLSQQTLSYQVGNAIRVAWTFWKG